MKMTPIQQRFVLTWGEMGARWGINRTVAQIHALLFLSEQPLDAETIASTLGVARSNLGDHVGSLDDHVDVVALHGEFDEPIAELFASGGECALQCTEASMRAQIPDFAAHANGDV